MTVLVAAVIFVSTYLLLLHPLRRLMVGAISKKAFLAV